MIFGRKRPKPLKGKLTITITDSDGGMKTYQCDRYLLAMEEMDEKMRWQLVADTDSVLIHYAFAQIARLIMREEG